MLTYKAMYKFCDDGVHAEVLDFPGAISSGADLEEAHAVLRSAHPALSHIVHAEELSSQTANPNQ